MEVDGLQPAWLSTVAATAGGQLPNAMAPLKLFGPGCLQVMVHSASSAATFAVVRKN
jgi:hypothetical protein